MRLICALLALLLAVPALAQSTSFTYQGRLDDGGSPANGDFDFRFTLYGVATGGSPVSGVVCAEDVQVVNGLFTVIVPLTPPTVGSTYLEVQVRAGAAGTCASPAGFTTLVPRQDMTPAPKAVFANAVPQDSPTLPGALRFNPTDRRFEGFDGAFWFPLTAGGALAPANTQTFVTAGANSFVVPAGVYTLGVELWGGGGAGGARGAGSAATSCATPGPLSGGGGGGAAGTYARATISVVPGELLSVYIAPGGLTSSTSGGAGQASFIARGATVLFRAYGGNGGQVGTTYSSVPTGSSNCASPLSGAGGTPGAAAQLLTAGAILINAQGTTGGFGRGPGCEPAFPSPSFCDDGSGGAGATGHPSASPLPAMSAGSGGSGGSPDGGLPSQGAPGRVRVFWH